MPYEPFHLEMKSAQKRFRRGERPLAPEALPRVIELPLWRPEFVRPCTATQVRQRLRRFPREWLDGLRAIFLLGGSRKQLSAWHGSRRSCCVGAYHDSGFIHLCALPFAEVRCLDETRTFFLDDVLVHELAHHLDRRRQRRFDRVESYAEGIVQQERARRRR